MDSKDEPKGETQNEGSQAVKPAEKEPQKDQPKVEQTETKTTSETVAQSPVKKGGSNVAVIIIVIVVVLAVLGVGGYFGLRYLLKKFSIKTISPITTAQTATPVKGQVSVKTVEDALMYPGAKITDQEHDQNSPYKSRLILQSSDGVKTIYDYYVRLAATNKYTISTQGTRDEDNYYLTLTDGVFTAEIDTTKYEGYDTSEIVIKISGDSLTSDSISISPTTSSTAKTAAVSATKTVGVSTGSSDYIINDSSTRVIVESELTGLTPWKLKVARNEIYARHGREFVHKDLQCYFAKKSWYAVSSSYTEGSLSSTENKNVATIQAYENETNSPLASSDSGCDTNQ